MSVEVNPKIIPSAEALEVAEEIRQNGGTLTAEEWEFSRRYEPKGRTPDTAHALEWAGSDGAIVGRPGSWDVYVKRERA